MSNEIRMDDDIKDFVNSFADLNRFKKDALKQRKLFLWGSVNDNSAEDVVGRLLLLESQDPGKEITLYINSPGGVVTAGMAIYDTMNYIRPHVATICIGQAASMGAFLLSSGEKGKRYALPYARIMIHQPLGGAQGQATDIAIQAEEILRMKKELNSILSNNKDLPIPS